MTPRIVDRTARRADIASAAARVFAERGVANTPISEIVKAAGMAQGTFYLYFESKDDVVIAVAQQLVEQMVIRVEGAAQEHDTSAVDRMLALGGLLSTFRDDPSAAELVAILHHPESHALHDRLAEKLVQRLVPLVESIVAQGIAEGTFDVPDTHAAAWFVLGGLQSTELMGTPPDEMSAAIEAATRLALRALGHREGTV